MSNIQTANKYVPDYLVTPGEILDVEGNGIYVVSVGSTLLVKRVDFDPANNTIELISANPAYETRRYSGEKANDIKIEEQVVATYHRL